MTIDLQAIKDRLDKATKGPWWVSCDVGCMVRCDEYVNPAGRVHENMAIAGCYYVNPKDNAEFIAHAPEDIAALIKEVNRLHRITLDGG